MATWDTTLETGDPLVDEQHKRIHKIAHDLESAEDTPADMMRILDELTAHVAVHFATEEDLMRRTHFARRATSLHKIEHERLTASTREYVLQFRTGELATVAPLADFLREWLSGHVESYDRLLIAHVQARGDVATLPEALNSPKPHDPLAS